MAPLAAIRHESVLSTLGLAGPPRPRRCRFFASAYASKQRPRSSTHPTTTRTSRLSGRLGLRGLSRRCAWSNPRPPRHPSVCLPRSATAGSQSPLGWVEHDVLCRLWLAILSVAGNVIFDTSNAIQMCQTATRPVRRLSMSVRRCIVPIARFRRLAILGLLTVSRASLPAQTCSQARSSFWVVRVAALLRRLRRRLHLRQLPPALLRRRVNDLFL